MTTVRAKVTMIGLICACLWLLLLVIGAQLRRGTQSLQLQQMEDLVSADTRENERLSAQLERMKKPAWLTLLARSRLNYKRPDETVVFVYKSEKSGTISQPQESSDSRKNWQKWLDWIRGE